MKLVNKTNSCTNKQCSITLTSHAPFSVITSRRDCPAYINSSVLYVYTCLIHISISQQGIMVRFLVMWHCMKEETTWSLSHFDRRLWVPLLDIHIMYTTQTIGRLCTPCNAWGSEEYFLWVGWFGTMQHCYTRGHKDAEPSLCTNDWKGLLTGTSLFIYM